MSDHDALLAAVLADPENDLPRLVFADWLEESGHPAKAARAQYIRLQIEAEKHPEDSEERLRFTKRAAALRGSFTDEADQVVPQRWSGGWNVLQRRRGFLDEVICQPSALWELASARVFEVAPIHRLCLRAFVASPGVLDHGAWLARIRTLRLEFQGEWSSESPEDALGVLLRCPHLHNLRALELSHQDIVNDSLLLWLIRRLPAAPCFARLTTLDFSGSALTDAGANALATAPELDRLTNLDLRGTRISTVGAKLLWRRFGNTVRL